MENNQGNQAVIRMALAMCAADIDSGMSHAERQWVIERLQMVDGDGYHQCFNNEEVTLVVPLLLQWADAYKESFGVMLRRLLTGGETDPYIRHGTQLELTDIHHRSAVRQPRSHTPRQRRSTEHVSTRRKG